MIIMHCFEAILILIPAILFSLAYTDGDLKVFGTKFQVSMKSKCDEQSVIQELWADDTFPFQFTCSSSFRRQFFVNWGFQISMANQTKQLFMPNKHWYIEWIDGSFSIVSYAIIEKPDECAGDRFKDVGILLSKTENDCDTADGVSRLDFVVFNITIEGKCASVCNNIEGYIKLDPAINKDGPVPT